CQEIIHGLLEVAKKLAKIDRSFDSADSSLPYPETSIAFNYALAVSWELASMIDQHAGYSEEGTLKHYGVNLLRSGGWYDPEFLCIAVMDPQIEEDMLILRGYSENQPKKEKPLFEHNNGVQLDSNMLRSD